MAGQQWPPTQQGWVTDSDRGPASGAWSLETISPYGDPLPPPSLSAPSWPPPPGADTGWTAEMYQTGPLRTVEQPPARAWAVEQPTIRVRTAIAPRQTGNPVSGPIRNPATGPITSPTRLLNRIAPPPAPVKVRPPWLRTPLLLRGTIAIAVAAAVLASVVRARLDDNAVANNVLQATNAKAPVAAPTPRSAPARANQPAASAIAGANQPAASVIAGANQPAASVIAGANQPAASVIGGANQPAASVIGGANQPAASVIGGANTDPNGDPNAGAAQPGAGCQINYVATPRGKGKYEVSVTVANTGPSEVDGWVLRWTMPAKQRITSSVGANVNTTGTSATATAAGSDRTLPANGRVTFGFITGPAKPIPPASGFALNGVTCS